MIKNMILYCDCDVIFLSFFFLAFIRTLSVLRSTGKNQLSEVKLDLTLLHQLQYKTLFVEM